MRGTAGGGDRRAEERVVGHEHQAGDRGVQRAHPGHGDRGLGLVLGAGEDDRAGDQRGGDDDGGDAGEQRAALDQQRDGAERHQEAGRPRGRYGDRTAGAQGWRSCSTTSVIASTTSS